MNESLQSPGDFQQMKYQIRAKNQQISHKRILENGTRRKFVSNFHEHKQPFGNKKKMTKYLLRCGPKQQRKTFHFWRRKTKQRIVTLKWVRWPKRKLVFSSRVFFVVTSPAELRCLQCHVKIVFSCWRSFSILYSV